MAPTSPLVYRSSSASPPIWPGWRATASPLRRPIMFPSSTRPPARLSRCSEIIQDEQPGQEIPITSHRVGDAKGEHTITAVGQVDTLELRHDAHSRRGFALGAVRGAKWIAGKSGAFDFRAIFSSCSPAEPPPIPPPHPFGIFFSYGNDGLRYSDRYALPGGRID